MVLKSTAFVFADNIILEGYRNEVVASTKISPNTHIEQSGTPTGDSNSKISAMLGVSMFYFIHVL